MEGMSRKDLIEEILGTHSHDYLVEYGFIKKMEKFERGCYFDGAFGHYYNSVRVIRFAEGLGWKGTMDPHTDYRSEPPTDGPLELPDTTPDENFDYEWLVEVVDEIEEWLDENTDIGENEHWCFSNGDFGLWLFDENGEHAE